jgi:hypothetical protein
LALVDGRTGAEMKKRARLCQAELIDAGLVDEEVYMKVWRNQRKIEVTSLTFTPQDGLVMADGKRQ